MNNDHTRNIEDVTDGVDMDELAGKPQTIKPYTQLPEINLNYAERLARETDYAHDAVVMEGQCECGRKIYNELNWADAGAFFLEGYEHARKTECKNLEACIKALEFIAFNNHPCWKDRDRKEKAMKTLLEIGTHVKL